jgi:nucleotide-binding universal stress UspA family protein
METTFKFTTVLVPTDGSALSDKAIDAAVEFARLVGGNIVGISVAQPDLYRPVQLYQPGRPYRPVPESAATTDYEESAAELAQTNVAKIASVASSAGVPYRTTIAKSFSPADEIIEAAKTFHCDVIFMASHGRTGLSKLMVGSETQKVLAGSSIPVMVFR